MKPMAVATARRITGSPSRPARRRRKPGRSRLASSSTSTSRPVSIRPQVEALTNRLSERPRWLAQSAEPIFSAISLSRVAFVGGAQQRLGQAHQRQALGGGEGEFLQEALDHPLPAAMPAGRADQLHRLGAHGLGLAAQGIGGQQAGEHGRLVLVLAVVEAVPAAE